MEEKGKELSVQPEVVGKELDISEAREVLAIRSQELKIDKEADKQLLDQASVFFEAEALPKTIKNAPQVYMMLKAGQERGLSAVESLNSFYFVNGKLSMYGPAIIAQVMRAGHIVQWGECDAKSATVKITRGDNKEISLEDTLTIEEAKQAGGTSEVWKKHTRNMLKYRVFRMVASFVVPDALQGISIESDTPFVGGIKDGQIYDVKEGPHAVMSNSDIAGFVNRLGKEEGYSSEEIKVAIPGALNREKLGALTISEAELVEKQLIKNRDDAAAATSSTSDTEQEGFDYDDEKPNS